MALIFTCDVDALVRCGYCLVTPAKPLTAGKGWRLVIAQGLPSEESGVRLLEGSEVKIGEVKPSQRWR